MFLLGDRSKGGGASRDIETLWLREKFYVHHLIGVANG